MKKLAMVALVFAVGCGTLFNESNTEVTITAPDDVRIMVDGSPSRVGKVSLSNDKAHVVTAINPDGSIRGTCTIDASIEPKYVIGNIFLGFWPLAIDAITGNWYSLDKNRCDL